MKKPKEGEPCNGCGFCCTEQICAIGAYAFPGETEPCPGIEEVDGISRCSLVLMESLTVGKPIIANALGIGKGCCTSD